MMKKYEYVSVDYEMKNLVMAVLVDYRDIIDTYASQGYRYVGMIPTEMNTRGCMRKIDLIFEKDE